MFKSMIQKTTGIRRAGSAALDLAYVANGSLDGFWEIGLSAWDIAAGGLLVREAGGIVTDLSGQSGWLESGNILVASPKIHEDMQAIIASHIPATLKN
jgi:myo-inositol-1(or 4)-monophosphatase